MSFHPNDIWMATVRVLLQEGYGCEDIARATESPLSAVQDEITILREAGELERIYAAPTASGFFSPTKQNTGEQIAVQEA